LSARYLLDTNVLSEPLRPHPNDRLMQRMQRHSRRILTAAPVWHELNYGYQRLRPGARQATIEKYLQEVVRPNVPVLPYDLGAAEWHARERARLSAQGRTPPFADGQIAAIASVNNLTLVTSNTDDFEPFEGLRIVDWRA